MTRRQVRLWVAVVVIVVAAAVFLVRAPRAGGTGGAGGAGHGVAAAERSDHPVYYVVTRQPVMALTFDDSWGDRVLPEVLAILRAHHQKATFFLSGPWARGHPDLVRQVVADGMEVGSHGQAHVNLGDLSARAIAANLTDADAILRGLTGVQPRFFRPPNGHWSPQVVREARALGMETVIWSVDSLDWLKPGPGAMVRRLARLAFPGAILLLHASDTASQTPAALPGVLDGLSAAGWRLTTLGGLSRLGPFSRVDNRGQPQKPNWPPEPAQAAPGSSAPSPAPAAPAAPATPAAPAAPATPATAALAAPATPATAAPAAPATPATAAPAAPATPATPAAPAVANTPTAPAASNTPQSARPPG